MLQGS
jgi:hypothetical protein